MVKEKDFSKMKESDSVVNYAYDRYTKGLSLNLLTIGPRGFGKSYLDQRLAERISKKIHGKCRFELKDISDDLPTTINNIRNTKYKGKTLIIEEANNLFSNRRAMASANVNMNKVLDTCRKKQIILFMNFPILKTIDSHIRSMADVLIHVVKLNKRQGVVIYKAFKIQTDYRTGKFWIIPFKRNGRDIDWHFARKPRDLTTKPYEDMKDNYMDDLYEELEADAQHRDNAKRKKLGLTPKKESIRPLSKQELQVYDLFERQGLKKTEIAKKIGVCDSRVGAICRSIEKKMRTVGKNELLDVQKHK